MNVLMVDQYGETGGGQRCLLDLLAGWRESGSVIVAAPSGGTLGQCIRDAGFEIARIPCGPYAEGDKKFADLVRFAADGLRQRADLRRLIVERRIDVVYVNGPRVLAGAALAARGICPVIFHMHNRLRRRSEMAVARWALARCKSKVVACCRHVAESLPEAMPAVIPNGVADAGFRARSYPPHGPWRIGVVGRISRDKGHLVLLDAVRLLSAAGNRIAITIAGDSLYSPAEHAATVRECAAGLDVRFTGWIEHIGSLLGEFDLLAVPSTAEPGLPRVVLEAFSAGLPVVALPSGGIPEAVRDQATGFLSADTTAAALAARLETVILGPPGELVRVARQARTEWELLWNVDRWRREVICAIRATACDLHPRRNSSGDSAEATRIRPAQSM